MRDSPTPQPPQFSLQQALTSFRNHFNPFSVKTHLESTFKNLKNHAQNNLSATGSSGNNPIWARISEKYGSPPPSNLAMSTEAIEERLAGVPVYALSNSFEEFVLISGANTRKSIGLFCFKEEDAETLLVQMKSMDPDMRKGSRVVAVALNKVFQLKIGGVGFRLIPELSQVINALEERRKSGISDESFSGIPVFQVLFIDFLAASIYSID
ncbi:hypothetical protein RJ640_022455 [Escallonia rubra]|uniref:Protein TIC 22-like, chloroplastic n=1 Tax=Escallonia rubra TaxID=112253 RepID=A0AA88U0X7_9ASTE|nr:hypothetical protein RJ640_022455 [Escallonia rubra]